MKVALIGGAGYIGTNLRNHFEAQNVFGLTYDKRAGHHAEDIEHFHKVDYVVHLAAYPGVVNCEKDLERATIDNVSSAFNVFRICHRDKIPCIFISSQAAKFPDRSSCTSSDTPGSDLSQAKNTIARTQLQASVSREQPWGEEEQKVYPSGATLKTASHPSSAGILCCHRMVGGRTPAPAVRHLHAT